MLASTTLCGRCSDPFGSNPNLPLPLCSWNMKRLVKLGRMEDLVDSDYWLHQCIVKLQLRLGLKPLPGVLLANDYRLAEHVIPSQFTVLVDDALEDHEAAQVRYGDLTDETVRLALTKYDSRYERDFVRYLQMEKLPGAEDNGPADDTDYDALEQDVAGAIELLALAKTDLSTRLRRKSALSDAWHELKRSQYVGRPFAIDGTTQMTVTLTLYPMHVVIGHSLWNVARAEAKSDSPNETGAAFTPAWESVLFRLVNVWLQRHQFLQLADTLKPKLFKSARKLKYKLDRAEFLGNAWKALQYSLRRTLLGAKSQAPSSAHTVGLAGGAQVAAAAARERADAARVARHRQHAHGGLFAMH